MPKSAAAEESRICSTKTTNNLVRILFRDLYDISEKISVEFLQCAALVSNSGSDSNGSSRTFDNGVDMLDWSLLFNSAWTFGFWPFLSSKLGHEFQVAGWGKAATGISGWTDGLVPTPQVSRNESGPDSHYLSFTRSDQRWR